MCLCVFGVGVGGIGLTLTLCDFFDSYLSLVQTPSIVCTSSPESLTKA